MNYIPPILLILFVIILKVVLFFGILTVPKKFWGELLKAEYKRYEDEYG